MPETSKERLQQLTDNAAVLRELLTPPTDKDMKNVKVFRAVYMLGDEVVSAVVWVSAGKAPAAMCTKRMGAVIGCSQTFAHEIARAEDTAVFLGLDQCEPRTPTWRQDKSVSGIIVMADAAGFLHPANGR